MSSNAERSRRTFPSMSIRRVSLMMVLGTMMVGQVVMLREMGVVAEVKNLYRSTVWFLFLYAFWPQISYSLSRGKEFAMNRVGN